MCKYCLECGWRARTSEGYTKQEVSRLAVDHFLETGHAIDSLRLPPSTPSKN